MVTKIKVVIHDKIEYFTEPCEAMINEDNVGETQ